MAVGLGLILAAAISVAVLVARSDEADRLVTHTFEVQQEAHTLLGELRTAENGQRGYVLTQNEDYLKPVDAAVAKVPGLLESLRRRTADNPSQQARLNRIEPAHRAADRRHPAQHRAHAARLATLIGLALLAAMVLAGVLAVATRQAVTGLLDRTRELEN